MLTCNGSEYPPSMPYTAVRALGTLLGCLVVPLAYLTIRNAGHSRIAGAITALAICFGNTNQKTRFIYCQINHVI